jgi:hypothetical protein
MVAPPGAGACSNRQHPTDNAEEESMKLSKLIGAATLALAFVMLASASAAAKNSKTIKIARDTTLHGTQLAKGNYQVQWENQSPNVNVTFKQRGEVVLTTGAKVEERSQKYRRDQVIFKTGNDGTDTIAEIRFAGSNQVLVFD